MRLTVAAPLAMLLAGTSGCQSGGMTDRQLTLTSLDDAIREAQRLVSIKDLKLDAGWSLPQILEHCAQSIEYSVLGFPEPKSALFQRTVGAAAYRVFDWRGRMSHNLSEAIPGAPNLNPTVTNDVAMARMHAAIASFRSARALKPHFAYGGLSKEQYARAHAMHFANHFSVIDA